MPREGAAARRGVGRGRQAKEKPRKEMREMLPNRSSWKAQHP